MSSQTNEPRTVLGSRALGTLVQRWQEGTFGEILEDWKWILAYTGRYRWAVAAYALLGILGASLSLLSAVASKYTIDIITGYETSKLALVLSVMIGASLLSLSLSSLTSYVSVRISLRVNNDIQAEIFDTVLDADWLALNRYPSGDLLNRFNADTGIVAENAIRWLPDLLISIYTFLATFFVIWHYDRIMALLALAGAPFLLLTSKPLLRELRRHNQTMKELGSELMSYEAETFYHMDTVKGLGLMERYGRGIRARQETFREASLRYNRFRIRTNALMSVLGSAVRMAGFCYCLYLLWSGKILYGTMTLFLTQGAKLSSTFNQLVGVLPGFLNSSVSAHRVRELQQLEKEQHLETAVDESELAGGLAVCADSVTFSYRERDAVLSSVSFRAAPGEIVALVGPSGEGKTTMIRLFLGLIRPGQGRTYLQTASGEKLPVSAETRSFFSYVPQGNTVLSGTVAENLRMVREAATDAELEDALRQACAWEFVSCLPDGLNSRLGERGRGLSEGQAQRLAIARAILRDAPVLLLDEATSALDAETERKVLQNIMRGRPDRTCIVTTHRPGVLTMCQRVYEVSQSGFREISTEQSGETGGEPAE